MVSVEQKQQKIIDKFNKFKTWEERYKEIINMGKSLAPLPEELRTDKKLIKGCQSLVWLHASYENGKVLYCGDSDAMIVKGLLAIVLFIFSEQDSDDIIQSKTDFLTELGLNVHLSQSRSNGLAAMLKQVKLYALALKSLQQQ